MANNNETTTKFNVDISELKKEFQEAKRQIRLANSEFKAATSGMDNWSKSADGLGAKINQLNKTLDAEKTKLKSLEQQYAQVVAEQGENSRGAQELMIKINNQKAAVADAERQLNHYTNQLDEMDSANDDVETSTKKVGEGFTVMKGVLADLIASGIKAAIQGFKDLAGAAKDAYLEFDEGYDNLIKATGATGETAKGLEASYKNVAKAVKGDFSTIGSALGEVNTRFGYTGTELENATELFIKFADITGTDATHAVQLVSRAMGDAGIDSSEYGKVLDELAVAAQASGISVDKLTEYLTKYGAPMRALGFDTKESIAIFSQWEKAGVNTETAFSGMKNAISNWSKEGKDAKVEFKKTLDEIAAAPDIASATTKAIEIFGKKAGPDLADAIQGGRFEYSDFLDLIEGSEGTVEKTYDQTQDGFDKVKLAIQGVKTDLADLVKNLLDKYGPQIEKLLGKIKAAIEKAFKTFTDKIVPKLEKAVNWIAKHLPEIEAGAVGIGVAFAAWKVAGIITAVTTALAGMSAAEVIAAAKTAILNTVLAANPIGLVVAAIAGLVAAFVVLWNKSESFREFWIGLWENIKEVAGPIFEAIKQFFTDLWEKAQPIIEMLREKLTTAITEVKEMFTAAWEAIKAIWDFVEPYFSALWEAIKKIFSGVVKYYKTIFTTAWNTIKKVWDAVKPYFKQIWESIKTIFSVVKDVLGSYFKNAWNSIKVVWDLVVGYFKLIWNNIKLIFSVVEKVFKGDFSGAWEAIKSIWNNVTGYFSDVWEGVKQIFSNVKNFFSTAFSGAWTAIKAVWNGVKSFFSGVWTGIKTVFSSVGTWFKNKFSDAWKKIKAVFDLETVKKFFGSLWDGIKEKFTSIGTSVGEAVGGAFKTAINWAIDKIEKTLNFLPENINDVLQNITDLTGIEVPLFPTVNLPRLAKGGVVNRSMLANIGEDGAEAVVPLENNTGWLDEIAKRLSARMQLDAIPSIASAKPTTITNNFYQTNNSPKALSRLEIYRQSKNLLRMKG